MAHSARKRLDESFDLKSIVEAAGGDTTKAIYRGGELEVDDLDQADLDAAVASYDHAEKVRERAAAAAREQISRTGDMGTLAEWLLAKLIALGLIDKADVPAEILADMNNRRTIRGDSPV